MLPRQERAEALEAPAFIACLHDMAVMGQPIQQHSRHLGITLAPLPKAQVGGDHHAGALITHLLSRERPLSVEAV